MRFNLARFGIALFGLATTVSALMVIFYNPFPGTNPISQFVGGPSISRCPPRPTRQAFAAEPGKTIQRPTPAPTPTPGTPQRIEPKPYPTLVHPLKTKKQALRHLYEIDKHITSWQEPWCLETLKLEPGRIKIESFASEYAYSGVKQPPAYRDPGPIWVVTIKGEVSYSSPCLSCTTWPHAYGLRYTIAKDTGMIGSMGDLPEEKK